MLKRHDVRRVPMRAILDRLVEIRDHGVDIDRIPLSLTISDLLRYPLVKIKELADGAGNAH